MHTDGKGLLAYYGTLKPLGDVDYYPNGGYDQPGCFTRRDVSARLDQHVTLDDRIRVQKVIGMIWYNYVGPAYFYENLKVTLKVLCTGAHRYKVYFRVSDCS